MKGIKRKRCCLLATTSFLVLFTAKRSIGLLPTIWLAHHVVYPIPYRGQDLSVTPLLASGTSSSQQDDYNSWYNLDQFVARIHKINDDYQQQRRRTSTSSSSDIGVEIVSRGSIQTLPPHYHIHTTVFGAPTECTLVVAICHEHEQVNPIKLQRLFPDMTLDPISSDEALIQYCGFPQATMPPMGHILGDDFQQSVIWVLDQSLLDQSQENTNGGLLLLGEAGYPLWKSLFSIDLLLQQPGVQVDDISDAIPPSDSNMVEPVSRWKPSTVLSTESTAMVTELSTARPYFPIAGLPVHLAKLITLHKDISNPLNPVLVTAIGQIGSILKRTKRACTCEFLPVTPRMGPSTTTSKRKRSKESHDNRGTTSSDSLSHPWRCATDDSPMMVELLFGKSILQHLGSSQGEMLIQNLQEGQLLQIQARTNPGERQSLQKWIDHRCLDLMVDDCRFLYRDDEPTLPPDDDDNNDDHDDHRNQLQPRTRVTTTALVPRLSLDNLWNGTPVVNLVESMDSLESFRNDITHQLLLLDQNSSALVGIDCEWQPSEFMEHNNQPQPVLLLQISFQALQTIHLFDFQKLLRPLQPPHVPMNEMEQEVSRCLGNLWESEILIKAGYQLPNDLQRIAASYPHMSCFQKVYSVLEVGSLVKKCLQISRQKKSRDITKSLRSMTSHYLGMTLNKQNQLSDWASRPLSWSQIEYAALDAAVSPVLVEKALESIGAYISTRHISQVPLGLSTTIPILERWNDDGPLSREIQSWYFLPLQEVEDEQRIRKLQAKPIVGSSWITSSNWITGQSPPPFPG